MQTPHTEHGYTLKELLAVMAVILLVGTLLLPRFEHTAKRANENSAINALRMVSQMEGEYLATYPTRGYACSLATLGGKKNATPTADSAALINDDIASGIKSGYRFTLSKCDGAHYSVTAVPIKPGKSGDRGFCTDDMNRLAFDPNGGTNCTELLK